MEIKEEKYDFIIKMVLTTFIGSGLLYGVVLILSLAIKKPITLGESLSYFWSCAYCRCYNIWGNVADSRKIMRKSMKKKEEENKKRKNLYFYINHVLEYNIKKFGDLEKKEVSLDIMKHIFVSIRKIKLN